MHISLFDLDRTLIQCNIILEFYLLLVRKQQLPISSIPKAAYNYLHYRYFDSSLIHMHHVAFNNYFFSRSKQSFLHHVDDFIAKVLPSMIYLPAYIELQKALHCGHYTAILTSTPKFIAEPFARFFGVQALYATEYGIDKQGNFDSIQRIVEGKEKAKIVQEIQKQFAVQRDCIIAYSDSFHDLDFLACSGQKIAVNPDKRLKDHSIAQKWKII